MFGIMEGSDINAESTEDKLRHIDQNMESVREAVNTDEMQLEKITIEYKENIVALDRAFEKCTPDSFYNEDL